MKNKPGGKDRLTHEDLLEILASLLAFYGARFLEKHTPALKTVTVHDPLPPRFTLH